MLIKIKTIISLCIVALLACSGCTGKADSAERQSFGKIYFVSNIFGGEKYGENTGTCVYENGKVNKLFQKYWLSRVNRDGKKIFAVRKDEEFKIYIQDLKTEEIKEANIDHHISNICLFNNDSSKIIYAGYDTENNKNVTTNMFLLDLETGEEKNLTNITEKDLTIFTVSISPDDKKIVYTIMNKQEKDRSRDVKILDIETGEEEILPFSSGNVTWSPSGDKLIMFGVKITDENKVEEYGLRYFIYDLKDKTYQEIKPEGKYFSEKEYTFSPDGKRIAYIRIENNGHKTLRTMNTDRTDEEVLIDWKNSIRSLSWTK